MQNCSTSKALEHDKWRKKAQTNVYFSQCLFFIPRLMCLFGDAEVGGYQMLKSLEGIQGGCQQTLRSVFSAVLLIWNSVCVGKQ